MYKKVNVLQKTFQAPKYCAKYCVSVKKNLQMPYLSRRYVGNEARHGKGLEGILKRYF